MCYGSKSGGAVRVFKTKLFTKFARRERILDASLMQAIERARQGLVDVDLGGGVIKQRVARQGQGRSGGYRTLIAFRFGDFAVFLFGFAKNEMDNIDDKQLASLQETAGYWLAADAARLEQALKDGILIEARP